MLTPDPPQRRCSPSFAYVFALIGTKVRFSGYGFFTLFCWPLRSQRTSLPEDYTTGCWGAFAGVVSARLIRGYFYTSGGPPLFHRLFRTHTVWAAFFFLRFFSGAPPGARRLLLFFPDPRLKLMPVKPPPLFISPHSSLVGGNYGLPTNCFFLPIVPALGGGPSPVPVLHLFSYVLSIAECSGPTSFLPPGPLHTCLIFC